jgi:hypothetical protein
MAWVLDYSDFAAERDSRNEGEGREQYIFSGDVHPIALTKEPQGYLNADGQPLPAVGSPHPADERFKLDRYSVARNGILSVITALYSTDGRFSGPGPNDDDIGRITGYSSSRADVVVDIPIGKRLVMVTRTVGTIDPPVPSQEWTDRVWKLSTFRVRESRRTRYWKTLIRYSEINAAEAAMDKQDGRLHNILGTWYLYRSSDIINTGTEALNGEVLYEITHAWTRDNGTLFPSDIAPGFQWNPNDETDLVGIIEGFASGIGTLFPAPQGRAWMRPPFHTVVARPSDNGYDPPVFSLILPYTPEPNGWRELPGLGL